jgi:hypothetical protein
LRLIIGAEVVRGSGENKEGLTVTVWTIPVPWPFGSTSEPFLALFLKHFLYEAVSYIMKYYVPEKVNEL